MAAARSRLLAALAESQVPPEEDAAAASDASSNGGCGSDSPRATVRALLPLGPWLRLRARAGFAGRDASSDSDSDGGGGGGDSGWGRDAGVLPRGEGAPADNVAPAATAMSLARWRLLGEAARAAAAEAASLALARVQDAADEIASAGDAPAGGGLRLGKATLAAAYCAGRWGELIAAQAEAEAQEQRAMRRLESALAAAADTEAQLQMAADAALREHQLALRHPLQQGLEAAGAAADAADAAIVAPPPPP